MPMKRRIQIKKNATRSKVPNEGERGGVPVKQTGKKNKKKKNAAIGGGE